jgi:hypothetical protein
MGMPFARITSRRLSQGRPAAGRLTGGRLAAGLSVVAGLALGSAAWATTSASAAPAATIPACTAADLAVWVNQEDAGTTLGTAWFPLEFTNTSGHACQTSGYPGVSATDASGRQLGDAAGREAFFPARVVVIPAGGTVHARLGWDDAEVSTSGCKPETAAELNVYPPNSLTADYAFFDLAVCTTRGHVDLEVAVVQPGTKI